MAMAASLACQLKRVMCVLCVVGMSACGGDSEPSAGTTTTPTISTPAEETTSTTRAPDPDLPALEGTMADFVERWNTLNGTVSEEYEWPPTPVTLGDFAVEVGPDGQEVFATQVSDSAVLGGLRDAESGRLTAVVVSGDPDGESTAGVVLTATVTVSTGEVLSTSLGEDYRAVALDPRPDNSAYTTVGAVDWVIFGAPGASVDDPLVMLVAVPAGDRETATRAAVEAQQAVLSLLAKAS